MKKKFTDLKSRFIKLSKKKRIIISFLAIYIILIPVILFAIGNKNKNVLGSSSVDSEGKPVNVIEEIGKLTELPTEEPLVSTIENASTLRDQIFFKKAQDGDLLLIFKENKRGVIYRPSTNQIIENTTIDVVAEAKPAPATTGSISPTYEQIINSQPSIIPSPEISPLESLTPAPTVSID